MAIKDKGKYKIYISNFDGSYEKQLTSRAGRDVYPSFSPDDRKIIYTSQRDGLSRVFIMDANGRGQRPITPINLDASRAVFSRDGKHLVFSAKYKSKTGEYDVQQRGRPIFLFRISLDGSGLKRLTSGDEPSFSNDGKKIAFINNGVCIMNADGSGVQQVTPGGLTDDHPSFSPDDKSILFSSLPSLKSARGAIFSKKSSGENNELYLVTVDGKNTKRLTYGKGDKVTPTWKPKLPLNTTAAFLRPPPESFRIVKDSAVHLPESLGAYTKDFVSGRLIYAFNDRKSAPYRSFLVEQTGDNRTAFRINGLQGTEGDFVFAPLLLPDGENVVVRLGDPVVRVENSFNSYRLWLWNRQTNALKRVGNRSLFFPTVALSPDGRRIAYVGGGDAEGTVDEDNPLTLFVCDLNTGKETLVARNDGVRGGFAWLGADTLLYTVLPQVKIEGNDRPTIRPNILSFDLAKSQSHLLIKDGARPTPSPDGKRIAFFGLRSGEKIYPLSAEWWLQPGIAALSVVNSDASGRKSYGTRSGPYPSVVWAPDNERLLFVRQTRSSPQAQANVGEWNVANDNIRSVADLSARDAEETERSWSKPQFQALGFSSDGKTLFVKVEEGVTSSDTFDLVHTIQAINLQDGKAALVARLKNDDGFDWKP